MDEIKVVEKKLFEESYVKKIPFEFFNYIASLIVSPEGFEEMKVPNEAEFYFESNEKQLASELFRLIVKNRIAPEAKSFTEAYTALFFSRYTKSFKENAKYSVRRIQTPEEYTLLPKVGIDDFAESIYIAFEVDQYIPKFENGEIDFEKLIEIEKKENNLSSYFSTITSIHFLAKVIWEMFKEQTSRKFVHYNFVYGSELEDMVLALSYEILFFFANIVYKSVDEEKNFNYIVDTVTEYYVRTTSSKNSKFSPDMEELEEKLNGIFEEHLNKMDKLTDKTKDDLLIEFIHIILSLVESSLTMPEFFYKLKLREASDFDMQDYRVRYALDLNMYMENGTISPNILESYGFVITEKSMREILENSFMNKFLFNRFIELD